MKPPGIIGTRLGFAWDLSAMATRSSHDGRHLSYVPPRRRTTGGNLVTNPFQSNSRIDFGNIDQIASLVSTALTRTTALRAVDPIFYANNLQLLDRHTRDLGSRP